MLIFNERTNIFANSNILIFAKRILDNDKNAREQEILLRQMTEIFAIHEIR